MSFIIGVLIGGAIVYYFLRNTSQEAKNIEQNLRQQLAKSESEVRSLTSQLEGASVPKEDTSGNQADLQAKTRELQQVAAQLSASEAQVTALRAQLAEAEAAAQQAVEEPAVPEPAVPESAEEPPSAPTQPEKLSKIEGIGPKVMQVLHDSGILTFAQLAQTDVDRLREILQEAGPRYKMMDPESWPEQAGLAANGNWDALQKLQDELDGGKYRR
jgi:predicted flap endonuclease-1-like 5' DNA nuclease